MKEQEKFNTSHIESKENEKILVDIYEEKKNSRCKLKKTHKEGQRTSDSSTKDVNSSHILDVSCSDLKDCSLSFSRKLQSKNLIRSQLPEVLSIQSIVGIELKIKFEALRKELENAKRENEILLHEVNVHKEIKASHEEEVEVLKKEYESTIQKLKEESEEKKNRSCICTHEEVIKQLKKEISGNEAMIDILNLKIADLTKSNKTLVEINENLTEQLSKRKEKMDIEMSEVYQQFQDLKKEFERKILNEQINTSEANSLLQSHGNKLLAELKKENKQMTKKMEELKLRQEKELRMNRSELINKEMKIREYESKQTLLEKENKDKTDLYHNLKKEFEICKDKLIEMRVKLDHLNEISKLNECEQEIHKIRAEFENIVKKKDMELKELKDSLDNLSNSNEKLKRLENALKAQIVEKDDERGKYQQMISEARQESEKLADENLIFKKNNYSLKSQVEVLEVLVKNIIENEVKSKNKEIKELKDNEKKYQMNINELKEVVLKKQQVIESKKKMNLLLIDLAKINKTQVQCIEGFCMTGSENLRESLADIRNSEAKILALLAEVSKDPDNTESEDESSDKEEEEG